MDSPLFAVHIGGDIACFTRPELKVERVSYEVITPSAARGVLEAILWKPAIHWEIKRIHVLKPISWMSFKRNEVTKKLAVTNATSAMKRGGQMEPLFADENRAQRHTLALRDVEYVIEAGFRMNPARDGSISRRSVTATQGRAAKRPPCFRFMEDADSAPFTVLAA